MTEAGDDHEAMVLLAIAVAIGFAAVIFTNRLIRHDHAAI
jgi:hypothetical protein